MKYLLLLLFISPAYADEWTTNDTYREITYQGLAAIDWLQTRNIAKNPNYYEQNPILGEHPSVGKVNAYFAITGLVHYGISKILPKEYRAPFQYVTIVVEGGAVAHNFSIGINAEF